MDPAYDNYSLDIGDKSAPALHNGLALHCRQAIIQNNVNTANARVNASHSEKLFAQCFDVSNDKAYT